MQKLVNTRKLIQLKIRVENIVHLIMEAALEDSTLRTIYIKLSDIHCTLDLLFILSRLATIFQTIFGISRSLILRILKMVRTFLFLRFQRSKLI